VTRPLPPGQHAIDHFPRFGVPRYANRLPQVPPDFQLRFAAEDEPLAPLSLAELPRRELVADFHCVTTWTRRDLRWSGWAFRDVWRLLSARAEHLELHALDGYTTCVRLEDLLGEDTLLADELDGGPIPLEHGAPLRLVVPHLYGYKNIKHVCAIRARTKFRRSAVERLTRAHPRGRVALEERGRFLPGVIYRLLYRAMYPATLWWYRRADRRRLTTPSPTDHR
jgi:hypothetical protein